jgi:hypothetical protein
MNEVSFARKESPVVGRTKMGGGPADGPHFEDDDDEAAGEERRQLAINAFAKRLVADSTSTALQRTFTSVVASGARPPALFSPIKTAAAHDSGHIWHDQKSSGNKSDWNGMPPDGVKANKGLANNTSAAPKPHGYWEPIVIPDSENHFNVTYLAEPVLANGTLQSAVHNSVQQVATLTLCRRLQFASHFY